MQVHAYELLYRSSSACNEFGNTDGDTASMYVIADSILAIGLDRLLSGQRAFINFGRNLLVDELPSLLPPDTVVIEVLESVEPDPDVLASCRRLRGMGYTIALDDFVWDPKFEPLLELADIVKVDVRSTSRREQERLCRDCGSRGLAMLAEKVETREEFEWTHQAGYQYFQGYFFAKPALLSGRAIQPSTLACLQLLTELQHPGLDFKALESLIRKDVALSHKLFSYVNSAQIGGSTPIDSIRRALVQLGEEGIRRWVLLAALPRLAADKPLEIVTCALIRARLCESVAQLMGQPQNPLVHLTGLFSVLDGLLGLPLDEALGRIGLSDSPVGQTLLGTGSERDILPKIYNLVRSYEAARWDAVEAAAGKTGITPAELCSAYVEATTWATQILQNSPSQHTRDASKPGIAPAPSPRRERRRHERSLVNATVTVLWGATPNEENLVRAKLVEVSARGAKFRLAARLPRGAWLMFNHKDLDVGGRGTVRHCRLAEGEYEVGVEIANGTGWDPAAKGRSKDLRRLGAAIQRFQSVEAAEESKR